MIRFKEYLERRARRAAFVSVCLVGLAVFGGLFLTSCANEDLGKDNDKNGGDKGAAVSFNVSEAQDDAQAAAKAMPGVPVTRAAFTEQLGMMNLTPEDLTTQRLAVQGAAGADLCLIETTTPGIFNPTGTANAAETAAEDDATLGTNGPATRANVTTMTTLGHFSSIGYRGTTATGISNTPWFHDKDTRPDGTLVSPIYWWIFRPYGKFFAIAPREASSYSRLKISPDTYAGTPYVDFEVEPNVKNQKDLMTACSGLVHYDTPNVAPRTDLRFRHALTAVRFKVGQNLSYSKTITKVEIIGAMGKGRYTLSADETGTGAAWSNLSAPQTFTLGGDGTVSVSTSEAVNQIILGNNGDNFTFYMIPQPLSGVSVKIHFSDGSTPITANLTGTWKPGTTKTYALSQNNSDWQYQLTTTSPAAVAYDQTSTGNYTIQSYREDPVTHVQQPVKWKVISYSESINGGATWGPETQTKPTWLTNLTTESGNGATVAETGTATLTTDFIDQFAARNKALKEASPLGSAGNPYDLSTKGGAVLRSTANCYVISAPGHYKIPLVYGNAITNGSVNRHAYISQAPTGTPNEQYVLCHFKDHNGQDITDPWITQSNGSANTPDAAKLVWSNERGLIKNGSLQVTGSGSDAYVQFEVSSDKISNGNAVIAVTKGGIVVWSWHLWFAPQEVLNTTEVTNFQNVKYNFTQETLGWRYTLWRHTTYSRTRYVWVKVEQEVANKGEKKIGRFFVGQKSCDIREGYAPSYQFGRKDAFPHVFQEGRIINGGDNMSIPNSIQHPETFYTNGFSWTKGYNWYNLWSMDNTTTGFNDNPICKTIYDPCPAGFKMPTSNAFTGFTKNGQNLGSPNVNGAFNNGYDFNNKINNPDAFVYFPGGGFYNGNGYDGTWHYANIPYWSAIPYDTVYACLLNFSKYYGVEPLWHGFTRTNGCAVRPVLDE